MYTFDNLKTAPDLTLPATLNDNSTQKEFEEYGVKKYDKGVCYYPYWIRHHNDDKNPNLTPMEFAVVRNNYYQMTINTVKGIGEYKPVDPDPTVPDDTQDSFLDVKVKVLPWTVRKNQIDF
ncbi:hypothetical protein EVA_16071 [gut metagenome]|uniref:Minor fimbrium subunit Mfa1 C-terminal domain-containing protein n=1 Tax=gut metagenome TaxID=749906 RepID=J9FLN5_9ZZZZ